MIDSSTFINVLLITAVMSVLGIIALFIYSFIKQEQEYESEQERTYEASIAELKTKLSEESKQAVKVTQNRVVDALENFSQTLRGKSTGAKEQIDQKAQLLMRQAENQIAEYKKSQLEKIGSQTQAL